MKVILKPLEGDEKELDVKFKEDTEVAMEVGSHHRYLVQKFQKNNRFINVSSKNRSAVRGGGAKPYKQKGTGNARRGTNRTPLRRGGGVIFGPMPRKVSVKVSKVLIKRVIKTMLLAHETLVVLDPKKFDNAKTNVIQKRYCGSDSTKYTLILSDTDYSIYCSFGNIKNVTIISSKNVLVDFLTKERKILLSESALSHLQEAL
jgi:large subunit ribosomal protein L4